jgi:hypothetical protein
VTFIIAVEAKWASSACSPQPDLKAVIADDFQGTSPTGRRYGKDEAITTDTKALARDCQLGEVKVRFFGDSIAVAYGTESWIDKANDGKETKRCQVWTDTWLKNAQGSGRSWPRRTRSSLVTLNAVPLRPAAMTNPQYGYEVRLRKDERGIDLISDALPFGRLGTANGMQWRTQLGRQGFISPFPR